MVTEFLRVEAGEHQVGGEGQRKIIIDRGLTRTSDRACGWRVPIPCGNGCMGSVHYEVSVYTSKNIRSATLGQISWVIRIYS